MPSKRTNDCSVVIYHSQDDGCWIAHSLYTDQIGTGERVVDALADLILCLQQVALEARKDPSVQLFRAAPKAIFNIAKRATKLPQEVFEATSHATPKAQNCSNVTSANSNVHSAFQSMT